MDVEHSCCTSYAILVLGFDQSWRGRLGNFAHPLVNRALSRRNYLLGSENMANWCIFSAVDQNFDAHSKTRKRFGC